MNEEELKISDSICLGVKRETTVTFRVGSESGSREILRLDKEGMIYRGERIEDAGEAYRAFMETMRIMQLRQ